MTHSWFKYRLCSRWFIRVSEYLIFRGWQHNYHCTSEYTKQRQPVMQINTVNNITSSMKTVSSVKYNNALNYCHTDAKVCNSVWRTNRITPSCNLVSSVVLALYQLRSELIKQLNLLFLSRKWLLKVIQFLQQRLNTVQRVTEVFIGKECLQIKYISSCNRTVKETMEWTTRNIIRHVQQQHVASFIWIKFRVLIHPSTWSLQGSPHRLDTRLQGLFSKFPRLLMILEKQWCVKLRDIKFS